MPYCTQADLLNDEISLTELIQLTDDERLGAVNAARVAQAISQGDELIDGYLRGRYTLPLTTVPPLIKNLSISLAVYFVHKRKLKRDMPESLEKSYDNTVKLLVQIQKGTVTLGIEAPDSGGSAGSYKTNKTSDDKMFPKDVLDTF